MFLKPPGAAKLKNYTNVELINLWQNAVRKSEAGHRAADIALTNISEEWKRRVSLLASGDYFDWPTTEVDNGDGSLKLNDAPDGGMLSCLGYRVGNEGQPKHLRRRILDLVFSGELPPLNSVNYVMEFGASASPTRLRKVANSLASFVRNAKRRQNADMALAISEWSDDLSFLYDKYYVGHFHFAWPKDV